MSKTKSPLRITAFFLVDCVSCLIFSLVLVACSAEKPDVQVVRETVVVEAPATVVVRQRVSVEVPVTRIIEVPVTVVSTPTADPAVNITPTPYYFEPYPYGTYVDIPVIDAIAREVLTRDSLALRERILFQESECTHPSTPWGAPCKENEVIGTQIDVFRYAYCEGFETRDEEIIMGVLEDLVSRTTGVYAIYSGGDEYFHSDGDNESYVIILTSIFNIDANAVFVDDEGINGILLGCGRSPDEVIEMFGNNVILPPISELQN